MKLVVDCLTNEVVEQELSDVELEQFEIDKIKTQAQLLKKEEEKIAKESAVAKLSALGLTEDEIKALVGA
jgi:hypothetical protein